MNESLLMANSAPTLVTSIRTKSETSQQRRAAKIAKCVQLRCVSANHGSQPVTDGKSAGTMYQYPTLLGCPISRAWHSFVPRIPWQRDPSRPMQICVKDVLDHPYQQQSQYECFNSFFHSSASWVSRHTSISRQARFHLIANGPWNVVLLACIVDRTRRRCTCDPDVFASKDLAARCEQRYQNCKRPHVYRSDHWYHWGGGSHNRHRVIVSVVEGAGEIARSIESGSLSLHHRRSTIVEPPFTCLPFCLVTTDSSLDSPSGRRRSITTAPTVLLCAVRTDNGTWGGSVKGFCCRVGSRVQRLPQCAIGRIDSLHFSVSASAYNYNLVVTVYRLSFDK